jgi:hypothetical protein
MTTKIQLHDLAQSVIDYSEHELVLLFQKVGGAYSSVTLPISRDGLQIFSYEDDIYVPGKINISLKAATGNISTNQGHTSNLIINKPEFRLDFTFRQIELGYSTV